MVENKRLSTSARKENLPRLGGIKNLSILVSKKFSSPFLPIDLLISFDRKAFALALTFGTKESIFAQQCIGKRQE